MEPTETTYAKHDRVCQSLKEHFDKKFGENPKPTQEMRDWLEASFVEHFKRGFSLEELAEICGHHAASTAMLAVRDNFEAAEMAKVINFLERQK